MVNTSWEISGGEKGKKKKAAKYNLNPTVRIDGRLLDLF